jgi:hypothetical protein
VYTQLNAIGPPFSGKSLKKCRIEAAFFEKTQRLGTGPGGADTGINAGCTGAEKQKKPKATYTRPCAQNLCQTIQPVKAA